VLVYNPNGVNYLRYPLVVVQGDDGRVFRDMRVVHGENPRMRYPGLYKDFGPQYTRGVAEWSGDGSFDPDALWLIYSVNKEDIWLARIPLPVSATPYAYPEQDFQDCSPGGWIEGWNVYGPRWAPVNIVNEPGNPSNLCMELKDGDPYDYARVKCLFPPDSVVSVQLRVRTGQVDAPLEIELEDGFGRRPVRLIFSESGRIHAIGGDFSRSLGSYHAGEWMHITLNCNQKENRFDVLLNGNLKTRMKLADASARPFRLVSLRTGAWRGSMTEPFRWNKPELQSDSNRGPVESGTDQPLPDPAIFLVDDLKIQHGF